MDLGHSHGWSLRWPVIRAVLLLFMFALGLFTTIPGSFNPPIDWLTLGVITVFFPLGLVFVIGIQFFNPKSAPFWRYPSWQLNPFQFREPLQFFHFGGFTCFAYGVGEIVQFSLRNSAVLSPEALILFAMGCGLLVGVWLCTIVFRKKMSRHTHEKSVSEPE